MRVIVSPTCVAPLGLIRTFDRVMARDVWLFAGLPRSHTIAYSICLLYKTSDLVLLTRING